MDSFNNQQRPGYDEIVSYGPKWWTEYREMDAVYKYAGWTLDLMASWLERIINNQFPAHADEQAISLFENILGIEPEPDDKLEERRRTVAAYYSGTGKLSRSVIQSIVKSYTGCDSELWWNGQTLQIRIFCKDDGYFSNGKIYKIVNRRFPAHLGFEIRDVLCTFVLQEVFKTDRVAFRIGLSWWDFVFDGKYLFDGTLQPQATFPPYFRYKLPFMVENPLKIENTVFGVKFDSKNNFASEIVPRHRVLLNWWEEFRTFDGSEKFDGSYVFDQTVPPNFDKEIHRMDVNAEEDFFVTLYEPSKAKRFDGSCAFDGEFKFNSGREEL